MALYADLEPVIKQLTSVCLTDDAVGLGKQMGINYALEILGKAPLVEAEPVVHAHWVDRYGYKYANKLYVCSRCGKKALYEVERDVLGHEHIVQSFTDRCPECGAYMDERYPDV